MKITPENVKDFFSLHEDVGKLSVLGGKGDIELKEPSAMQIEMLISSFNALNANAKHLNAKCVELTSGLPYDYCARILEASTTDEYVELVRRAQRLCAIEVADKDMAPEEGDGVSDAQKSGGEEA